MESSLITRALCFLPCPPPPRHLIPRALRPLSPYTPSIALARRLNLYPEHSPLPAFTLYPEHCPLPAVTLYPETFPLPACSPYTPSIAPARPLPAFTLYPEHCPHQPSPYNPSIHPAGRHLLPPCQHSPYAPPPPPAVTLCPEHCPLLAITFYPSTGYISHIRVKIIYYKNIGDRSRRPETFHNLELETVEKTISREEGGLTAARQENEGQYTGRGETTEMQRVHLLLPCSAQVGTA